MLALQFDFKNDKQFAEAYSKAPNILLRNLRAAISKGGSEIARKEKELVPKAHSGLVNSIHSRMDGTLSALIKPDTDYDATVEYGSAPGGYPPVQVIYDWIRVKGITPDNPKMDQQDLAFVMSKSIAKKGIKAKPYATPALAAKENRLRTLLNQAVRHSLNEAGL